LNIEDSEIVVEDPQYALQRERRVFEGETAPVVKEARRGRPAKVAEDAGDGGHRGTAVGPVTAPEN